MAQISGEVYTSHQAGSGQRSAVQVGPSKMGLQGVC
jgi:hypothetical protein